MGTDTEVIEKAKGTMAKIILAVIVAPLALTSTIWLFTTVIATHRSVSVIEVGMSSLVVSIDKNTEAIVQMQKTNNLGHGAIANMVHELKLEVATSNTRLDHVEHDCEVNYTDIKTHTNGHSQ